MCLLSVLQLKEIVEIFSDFVLFFIILANHRRPRASGDSQASLWGRLNGQTTEVKGQSCNVLAKKVNKIEQPVQLSLAETEMFLPVES